MQFEAGGCRGQSLGFNFCVGEGPGGKVLPGAEKGPWGERPSWLVKRCRTPQELKTLKKPLASGVPTLWQLPAFLCFEIL